MLITLCFQRPRRAGWTEEQEKVLIGLLHKHGEQYPSIKYIKTSEAAQFYPKFTWLQIRDKLRALMKKMNKK